MKFICFWSDDLDESKMKQDDDEDVSMSSIPESSKKTTPASVLPTEKPEGGEGSEEGDKLPFPSSSDLNTRLRRIITSFQRNHKRMLIKNAQRVKVDELMNCFIDETYHFFSFADFCNQFLKKSVCLVKFSNSLDLGKTNFKIQF